MTDLGLMCKKEAVGFLVRPLLLYQYMQGLFLLFHSLNERVSFSVKEGNVFSFIGVSCDFVEGLDKLIFTQIVGTHHSG